MGTMIKRHLRFSSLFFFVAMNQCNSTTDSTTANKLTAALDRVPPTVSDTTLTVSNAEESSTRLQLNWSAAFDNTTKSTDLVYDVYFSTFDLGVGANWEDNINARKLGTNTNIVTFSITDLSPSTLYYFMVSVKDQAGNKDFYQQVSYTTPADDTTNTTDTVSTETVLDQQDPVVFPSEIVVSNLSTTGLTLQWTKATDNHSMQNALKYRVYYSNFLSDVDTLSHIQNSGTVVAVGSNFTTNIESLSISGLTPNTSYYFNVIVADEANNFSAYRVVQQTTPQTADITAPTLSSAVITASSVSPTSLQLSWEKGSDDRSSQSALQYRAYYSTTSTDVDTLTHINAGGSGATGVGSGFSTDINGISVTGLTQNTPYYFNVVVKDEAGNMTAYTLLSQSTTLSPDITEPTLSSTSISASSVAPTSLSLSWTKATDDRSAQSALQYRVYYSTTSSHVDTLSHINAGGATAVGSGFSTDINTISVTGLTENTLYYFNVVVKDEVGNMTAYSMVTQATIFSVDSTSPILSSATIAASSVTYSTVPLSWTKATDNRSAQSALQYRVYYSTTSSDVDTLAHINAGGSGATGFGSGFSTDINSLTVTGLTMNTTYYLNIVVKDEATNMTAYTMITQATPDFIDADGDGVADSSDICAGWNDALVGGVGFDINVDVDADGLTTPIHTASCPSSVTGYVATASSVADSDDASHVGYSYNSNVKTESAIGVDVDGGGTISSGTNVNVISNLNQWFDFAAKCSNGVTTTCTGNFYLANDLDFGTLAGRTATTNNIPADAGSTAGKFTITNALYVLGQAGTSSTTYAFQGSLHGGDYKLKNLIVDLRASNFVGGVINNSYMARVQHLTVKDSYVKGKQYVGGIIGYSQYTDLLYVTNDSTTVESFLTTDARNSVGGIAGQSYGVASGKGAITYATNSGSVKCQSQICYNAGGLVGYFQSQTMDHSSNSGSVNPDGYGNSNSNSSEIAGLAGLAASATIQNSYNTGTIKGRGAMGGITGYAAGTNTFTKVYNKGIIQGYYASTSAYGMQCGGVVGYLSSSSINNAYNTGAITCGKYTGGIVGSASAASNIQYTVNIGTITDSYPSDTNAGGITAVAPTSGTCSDNYYWSSAYSSDKCGSSTSLSNVSDFNTLSTFINFSDSNWQIQNSLSGSITSRPTLIAIPE